MIATLVIQDGRPTVPLPHRAMNELDLHEGQYVRIDLQPLGMTPILESDGLLG